MMDELVDQPVDEPLDQLVDERVDEPALYSWKNRWFRGSASFVGAVTIVSLGVGFVWLPSLQGDFTAQGIWSSICRAAGVPARWGDRPDASVAATRTTEVVLTRSMAQAGSDDAVGLGATIAFRCTVCHGAHGVTDSDTPNLAGQYREVIVKQLADYRNGDRINAVMQAFAKSLSAEATDDVATYYASLPRPSNAVEDRARVAPRLVRAGDPMRNIAPCAACHGEADHKLGAPWLEAMPKAYLVEQLDAFAAGRRRNDGHGQMRNVARRLSGPEIDALVAYYARS